MGQGSRGTGAVTSHNHGPSAQGLDRSGSLRSSSSSRRQAVKVIEPRMDPSLSVFAVVLDCLAVVALPALRDEVDGLLDVVTVFTRGCVNPDRPAVGGRPRPVLDRLPAMEEGPRPGLANAERRPRRRGRRRAHGTRHEARSEVHFLPT